MHSFLQINFLIWVYEFVLFLSQKQEIHLNFMLPYNLWLRINTPTNIFLWKNKNSTTRKSLIGKRNGHNNFITFNLNFEQIVQVARKRKFERIAE